jgi:3-hydroxybutyryl-CoA dehydrogenase
MGVAVVGLGPMGRGIARCFAAAGATVEVVDIDAATTARQLALLHEEHDGHGPPLAVAAADSPAAAAGAAALLIEAVAERPELKAELLGSLAASAPEHLVVASNTSSLSIGELGVAFGDPRRVLGMHFFNPVERMRLVEIVRGPRTDPAIVDAAREWVQALGKTPIVCADSPNFVVNRVCRPLYYEAQLLVTQGVPAPAVDAIARGALGHRMGPLELLDFAGLHTHLGSSETAHRELGDPRYRPIPITRALVRAGATGRAAGRGYYDYEALPPKLARAQVVHEPARSAGQPISVTGPGAAALLEHAAIAAHAEPGAELALYSAPSSCTVQDRAAVRELLAGGARAIVDSSHSGWLTALPAGAGWIRLHGGTATAATAATAAPFAEVVEDLEAGIGPEPGVDALLGAIGASGVAVPALPGLVADRLQYTLINEAVTVVEEGTAAAADVDLALVLGMNHPAGPFSALGARGEETVLAGLRALQDGFGDPRYRPAPLLVRRASAAIRRRAAALGDTVTCPPG